MIRPLVGVFSNGISNVIYGRPYFEGAGQAAFWGAVSSGISLGIGSVFGSADSFGKELGRAGIHSLAQGSVSAAQGGNFWQGALSGGISSGIGSGIDALGGGVGEQIFGGGIGGGIGAAITGGNILLGFSQGFAVGAFNHALHNAAEGGGDPKIVKEETVNGNKITYYDDGSKIEVTSGGYTIYTHSSGISSIVGLPSGAAIPTDSPIEMVIGFLKTPFSYGDDLFRLGFSAFGGKFSGYGVKAGMSYNEATKLLYTQGWSFVRSGGKGSHMIWKSPSGVKFSIPQTKSLSIGLVGKINKLQ